MYCNKELRFKDLATIYLPNRSKKAAAIAMLRWINYNRDLRDELIDLNWRPAHKTLTTMQVYCIINKLGDPLTINNNYI